MIKIQTNICHTQAFGCFMLLQIYSVAFLIGRTKTSPWIRLELFKPRNPRQGRFRFSLEGWGGKGRPLTAAD